jgi:uncharacterized Zn finger protein
MSDWWRYSQSGPRRPARDGIPARSQRGDIGETWWSKRFLAALEPLTDPNRLKRGRSYARSGQVMKLEVGPGRVGARVQGSRPEPYAVRIEVPPLAEDRWGRVEEAMAGQALFLAALLAGEMPRDIEEAFTAAGLSLFPTEPRELATACSCPDWANPCKHVAATFYILAEAFDADPFLIFAWRGRGKDELIARLRARRARAGSPSAPDGVAGGPHAGGEPAGVPLPTAPAAFWGAGAVLEELRFAPRAPESPDALLRQLGPAPIGVRGRPLDAILVAAYRELTVAAERRARGA